MDTNIKARRQAVRERAISNRRLTIGDRIGLTVLAVVGAYLIGAYALGEGSYTCRVSGVTVQYGDTLWQIVRDNCEGDLERATDDLSDKYGRIIQHGQRVELVSKD